MKAIPLRVGPRLHPDPRRVIAKLFVAGEESPDSESRVHLVIERVAGLTSAQVSEELAAVRAAFAGRHHGLETVLRQHAALVSEGLHAVKSGFTHDRLLLLGAYLTHEYAVEAAALCNPSMVAHPDQTGLPFGTTRFLMSVRAIGEGHCSSIEFRTGYVAPGRVEVDDPGTQLAMGIHSGCSFDKASFIEDLVELGTERETARQMLSELPAVFHDGDLRQAIPTLHPHLLGRGAMQEAIRTADRLVSNSYEVRFSDAVPLGQRLIWPAGPSEAQGMEDLRLVRFVDADGAVRYHGTYTAYDGTRIAPHLLTTHDFRHFHVSPMAGPAALNKGMALFPRRVGGRHVALSRWDRENISIAFSDDGHRWERGPVVRSTAEPWEFIQVGNCGSPLETDAGWLVLTHGVGPMRTYSIGAILLDLENPHVVVAEQVRPLLTPEADERDGYVPNVVYSCGGLMHDGTLTIPYGISDTSIGFAQVSVPDLLAELIG